MYEFGSWLGYHDHNYLDTRATAFRCAQQWAVMFAHHSYESLECLMILFICAQNTCCFLISKTKMFCLHSENESTLKGKILLHVWSKAFLLEEIPKLKRSGAQEGQ